MKDTRKYWMWLSHRTGAGSKIAVDLVSHFENAEAVYKRREKDYKKLDIAVDPRVISRLENKDTREEESIISWCDANGVRIITPADHDYPRPFLELQDSPMVLYCLGELPDVDDTFCCTVVGTRKMSEYGKQAAYKIGAELADGGACVVSGGALGIDGMALAGAIEAGGRTVCILGCGIDVMYPRQHEKLFRKVVENGALITEYAPGVSPFGHNFPVRNRLLSGISPAVCIVEGELSSGAMITARHADNQGKKVYTVPGRIHEKGSEAPIFLIRGGAVPIMCADDILSEHQYLYPHSIVLNNSMPHIPTEEAADELKIGSKGVKAGSKPKREEKVKKEKKRTPRPKKEAPFPKKEPEKKAAKVDRVYLESLGETERKIYEYMKADVPMLCDEIAKGGFDMSQIMVAMTLLEIAGVVEASPGGYFLKRSADYGGDPEYITEDDDGL